MLGVSQIVTKAALRKIADEKLVVSRPRIGSVVCAPGTKRWRGHVLAVCPGGDENYVETVLASVLRDRLAAADYLFTLINVPYAQSGETLVNFPSSRADKFDFSRLDVALAQHVDLIVAVSPRLPMLAYLAKQKVPYVVFGGRSTAPASAVGHIRFDMALAMESTPFVCFRGFFTPFLANSPRMLYPGPPMPVPSGSPPWIIKPAITRWKIVPS